VNFAKEGERKGRNDLQSPATE